MPRAASPNCWKQSKMDEAMLWGRIQDAAREDDGAAKLNDNFL